jgi:LCP family protein required for cell wall assembly
LNTGKTNEEAIKVLQSKITEITNINFDYYAEVDFAGFVKIVDKIGGVEVDVKEAIDDPYYPGPNYSYQRFTIQPGIQTLDGETALKYARSRHTTIGGDLDRSRRQQQILGNLKDKVFSLNPILDSPTIISLFGITRETVKTDLSLMDIKSFYDTYKDSKDYSLTSLVVGNDLLKGNIKEGYRQFGSNRGYILEPRLSEKNYFEIQEEIANIKDIPNYQEKLSNLNKDKFDLEIVFSDNISKTEINHIQEFLKSRGFNIKGNNTSLLNIKPDQNTFYIGNNPYNQSEVDNSSAIYKDYIQDIFNPNIDTSLNLTKDTPILYIANTLKF